MRILICSLSKEYLEKFTKSNERTVNFVKILSSNHELIYLKPVSCYEQRVEGWRAWLASIKLPFEIFHNLIFALRGRREFDIIFSFKSLYGAFAGIVGKITSKATIWDLHSGIIYYNMPSGSLKFSRGRTLGLLDAFFIQMMQKVALKLNDRILVDAEVDREALLKKGISQNKVIYFPICEDLELIKVSNEEKECLKRKLGLTDRDRILVFIGSRFFWSNKKAAFWINDYLAPLLVQKFKNVRVLIGSDGPLPTSIHPIVLFTGFVPNIYALIQISDIALAPVWEGTGMTSKVLDFMACGKPTVVTPWAAHGIPQLRDGVNVMIAQNEQEFVEKTVYLLKHPDEACQIGERAKEMVERYYSWNIWKEKLNKILEDAIYEKAQRRYKT